MRRWLLHATICFVLAGAALAQGRTQVTSGVVEASAEALWQGLTTDRGLIETWSVAQAKIDLRIGGTILTHYDPNGTLGDANTIRHEILSFEPGRMLALRSSAPANAPEFVKQFCSKGWHVIRLEPLGAERTRYTETGCGYGEDEDSRHAFEFFERGNRWTLERLQERHAKSRDAQRAREIVARLAPLVGGDFNAAGEAVAEVRVRARTRWSTLCEGFTLAESWLATAENEPQREHGFTVYGVDPFSGDAAFWKFGDGGSVARGALIADGPAAVGHLWTLFAPNSEPRELYVQLEPSRSGYVYRAQPARDDFTTLLEFRYTR